MKENAFECTNEEHRNDEFLALLGQHELKLASCVHMLVPSWHDAEDILQETRLRLWHEFSTFRPGSDFLAWARTVARYVTLAHIKKSQRRPVLLSGEIQDLLMREALSPQCDVRLETLANCIKRLSAESLVLLRRCYVERQKIRDVAVALGRSLPGTYKALSRIRRELFDCVQDRLHEGDSR